MHVTRTDAALEINQCNSARRIHTHTQPFSGPEDLTQGLVSAAGQSFADISRLADTSLGIGK